MKTKTLFSKHNLGHYKNVIILALVYTCIGYSVTEVHNPITGYPIAFNMVVIVLAGALFGKNTGFFTGIMAGILAFIFAITFTAGSHSPALAIATMFPDAIMGYLAGFLTERYNIFIGSLSIIVGHTLNIAAFILFSLIPINLASPTFWQAISFETVIDVVSITMTYYIFLISFPFIRKKW